MFGGSQQLLMNNTRRANQRVNAIEKFNAFKREKALAVYGGFFSEARKFSSSSGFSDSEQTSPVA